MAVAGSNRYGASDTPAPRRGGGLSGHAQSRKIRFVITAQLDNRRDVQQQILDLVQRNGFEGQEFFAINLALEEALTNAIKHGNRSDPAKKVIVEARVTPKRVEVLVEDEGPGFDRKSVPDPTESQNLEKCCGRGILLIEAYMNRVSWDRGGRRLKMVKLNSPR
jgi:serine/threonine-protein kinase RsbW